MCTPTILSSYVVQPQICELDSGPVRRYCADLKEGSGQRSTCNLAEVFALGRLQQRYKLEAVLLQMITMVTGRTALVGKPDRTVIPF